MVGVFIKGADSTIYGEDMCAPVQYAYCTLAHMHTSILQYMLLQVSLKLKDTIHSAVWDQWKQKGRKKCRLPITKSLLRLGHRLPIEVRHYFFIPTDRNCSWINIHHQPSSSAVLEAAKPTVKIQELYGQGLGNGGQSTFWRFQFSQNCN